ncbi:hypothetical protein GCM10009641_79900 [Mycobacterium cookii]
MVVALGAAAGGAHFSSVPERPGPAAAPAPARDEAAEAAGIASAEATVRAFFAVRSRARQPTSRQIDKQAVYLTSRDVHPTAAYEAGMEGRPSMVTDSHVSVALSNARWVGDTIRVDFEFDHAGTSYPMIGDELQMEQGQPAGGYWHGTATLVDRDGEWLIDRLTADSYGGSLG